ncbi:MAG: hypothetical protein KR126chlam4_00768 [Candidatus Anoxychlamydiales bacterium]|uniref:PsbP C-terminal domain-containing protein n=1 Tax=marine sediment metagenome TaxID=412755 RepID=A0A0F9AWG9_9ZZZZ|nr:hypothetical protein [Candidatus Anoxychlamydiales bacterium]NGX40937.1 hypothetical protein [Candidatus Anoxychlamydiales bacterium]HEU63928.1 hypothetical protein [Chlamydiota bacterium]
MKKFIFLIFVFSILISHSSFSWEKFYSIEGKCEVLFPNKPEHMRQVIPVQDLSSFMNYDVYLSVLDDENSICMMIIVDFPAKIDDDKELQSLEGFLNGIINHREEKKLISADFTTLGDLNALDFVVEDQNRYFKGRAIISESKMYLIAMEYDSHLDLDISFSKYIESFHLKNR